MEDNIDRELTVRFKVQSILDQKSFREFSVNYNTRNILSFTGYDEKIKKAKEACGEVESVITGIGKISGFKSVITGYLIQCFRRGAYARGHIFINADG